MTMAGTLYHSIAESRWSFGRGEVLGGVVAGLIASGIAWGIARLVRWRRNVSDFGVLVGNYDVFEKEPSAEAAGTVPDG